MECVLPLSLLLAFTLLQSVLSVTVPSNFYGSPEVFSGYLSDQEKYVDAFTMSEDHVHVFGSIPDVEHQLEVLKPTSEKLRYNFKKIIRPLIISICFRYQDADNHSTRRHLPEIPSEANQRFLSVSVRTAAASVVQGLASVDLRLRGSRKIN